MQTRLFILDGPGPDPVAERIGKVAGFLGARVEASSQSKPAEIPRGACVAVSAQRLADAAAAGSLETVWRHLLDTAGHLLVFGLNAGQEWGPLLNRIAGLSGVVRLQPEERAYSVAHHAGEAEKLFAGLAIGSADPELDAVFTDGPAPNAQTHVIRIGKRPCFVHWSDQNCKVFLLAGRSIPDLDQPAREDSLLGYFGGLVPLIIFLRAAFAEGLWHNPRPGACFIVDDPLLKDRYGFLDYAKLLAIMERERFCTSLAFIPWNCRRSERRAAALFQANPARYSLCVHGCDHTAGEFGSQDEPGLTQRAKRGLALMRKHERLSGLAFDDVMVFPQGVFSGAAMKSVATAGYLAAINSSAFPTDAATQGLKLRDLLEAAVVRFSDCSLFLRRYPQVPAEVALDLFLGKPALLVEHHGYFKDGCAALIEAVRRLNQVRPGLAWENPAEVCSRTCWTRVDETGDVHVRFYCDRFLFTNSSPEPRRHFFVRRGAMGQRPGVAIVNGRPVEAQSSEEGLRFTLMLEPGQTTEVRLRAGSPESSAAAGLRPLEWARVFVRRRLCELRDQHLDTNRLFTTMTGAGKGWLARVRRGEAG